MTRESQLQLELVPEAAAQARVFLNEQGRLDSMRHAEADLLVTELIANALEHSDAESFVLQLDREERGLVVSVTHSHPQPIESGEGGVGFMLVDRLSQSWGHDFDDGELTVWFVIRTPGTTSVGSEVSDDELFERMHEDPVAYSDELVRRHRDLARSIARRYRGKGIDDEDLNQASQMALVKAIQRYDPSLGSIRPYAAATISGELKRLLRDRGWSVRVPRSVQERTLLVAKTSQELAQSLGRPPEPSEIAERLDLTAEEVVEALDARQAYTSASMDQPTDTSGITLLDRLEVEDMPLFMADDRMVVAQAMSRLPERQQRIVQLRFNDDMTQSEIAKEVGISQMHVSRLLSRAFETLRKTMDEEPMDQ